MGFVHGSRCRRDRMKRVDLSRSQCVVGIGELPAPAGLAATVLVVLAAVGSRSSHGALPASSSYDTYGYTQNAYQQQFQQMTLNA